MAKFIMHKKYKDKMQLIHLFFYKISYIQTYLLMLIK
jgi:hypothetical protein